MANVSHRSASDKSATVLPFRVQPREDPAAEVFRTSDECKAFQRGLRRCIRKYGRQSSEARIIAHMARTALKAALLAYQDYYFRLHSGEIGPKDSDSTGAIRFLIWFQEHGSWLLKFGRELDGILGLEIEERQIPAEVVRLAGVRRKLRRPVATNPGSSPCGVA